MEYMKSETTIAAEQVAELQAKGVCNEWTNPRTGKVRYYINLDGMAEIINLEVSYYKSGYCSGVSYTDLDGERVVLAHKHGWSSYCNKVYIEDGIVYGNWNPEGVNIAELVAIRVNELCGIDPDNGDGEELYRVTCDDDYYMTYDYKTIEDAKAKADEANAKWPERSYRVAHIRVGAKTGRVVEL